MAELVGLMNRQGNVCEDTVLCGACNTHERRAAAEGAIPALRDPTSAIPGTWYNCSESASLRCSNCGAASHTSRVDWQRETRQGLTKLAYIDWVDMKLDADCVESGSMTPPEPGDIDATMNELRQELERRLATR